MSWRTRDFFEAWPPLTLPALGPVDTPSVFLLHLVMHDWKDDDCKRYGKPSTAHRGSHALVDR